MAKKNVAASFPMPVPAPVAPPPPKPRSPSLRIDDAIWEMRSATDLLIEDLNAEQEAKLDALDKIANHEKMEKCLEFIQQHVEALDQEALLHPCCELVNPCANCKMRREILTAIEEVYPT